MNRGPAGPRWLRAARWLSAVYLAALTWGLFAKDPGAWLVPEGKIGGLPGGTDKAAHLAAFAGLAVVMLAARWPASVPLVLGLLAAYSVGTECVQALLPWRSAEVADALMDLLGIALGAAVFWAATWPRARRPR